MMNKIKLTPGPSLSKRGVTTLPSILKRWRTKLFKVVTPLLEREGLGVSLTSLTKTIAFFLFVFLQIISCKKAEKAELLIPDDKMIDVLVDLHIAEAAILSANKAQKDSIGGIYFKQIFEMYQIQDSLFYKNLDLISKDPVKTEAIYEKVIEKIEKLDLDKDKNAAEIEDEVDEVGAKKKK